MKIYPFFAYTQSTLDGRWHIEKPHTLESGNTVLFYCGLRSHFGVSMGNLDMEGFDICRACNTNVETEIEQERKLLSIFFK